MRLEEIPADILVMVKKRAVRHGDGVALLSDRALNDKRNTFLVGLGYVTDHWFSGDNFVQRLNPDPDSFLGEITSDRSDYEGDDKNGQVIPFGHRPAKL